MMNEENNTTVQPVIDISGQQDYSASQLRKELVALRKFIIDLAATGGEKVSASEMADHLQVLNWLVDDVELQD